MNRRVLFDQKQSESFMESFDEHILFSLERRYLDFIDPEHLELAMNPALETYDPNAHLRLIRLDEISHEGEEQLGLHLSHMQNILSAMQDDSHNVVSVIRSDGKKVSMFYGLSKRFNSTSSASTNEFARILTQTVHGNFLGARFSPLGGDEAFDQVLGPMVENEHIVAFPGIPSLRHSDPQGPYVQGIDRFIEGMRGEEYCLVTIAEPISLPVVDGMIKNLFDLGSSVHSEVRATIQQMKGSSDTVNVGMFGMQGGTQAVTQGEAETEGTSTTEGTSESTTHGSQDGVSRLGSGGAMSTAGAVVGGAIGSIVPGFGTAIGAAIGGVLGTGAAWLSGAVMTRTAGTSLAETIAKSNALTKTQSFTRSVANTAGRMTGLGGMGGYARGWNRSTAVSREVLNKMAEHGEKLCDAYIERLQRGKNLGLWNVGTYLMTKNRYTLLRGRGLLRSAFSGDETHWEPIRSVRVNSEAMGQYLVNFNNPRYNLFLHGDEKKDVEEAVSFGSKLKNYASKLGKSTGEVLGLLKESNQEEQMELLEAIRRCPADYTRDVLEKAWMEIKNCELGHPLGPVLGGVSTPLNTEELSIMMNVPRHEVQGVTIRQSTAFGVNYKPSENGEDVSLGRVVHKREPLDDLPYKIPRSLLQKHAFVCGVTGSGKTNTCFTLLNRLNLPFLVIEPAKTEYRALLRIIPDLKTFSLGNENISPFRINPFEFIPGSELLTHIDNIKAVFNAAFPMYAAMPYILEEAIVEIYLDRGWDLATSKNKYLNDIADERFYNFLPTLEDLLEKIDQVVRRKDYAQELSMNYSASLKARLSSLLTGSKGLMLNTRRSTPMDQLLSGKVVLELKYVGDDDEKCFLMGLILSRIYEFREVKGHIGSSLSHVLLIEEAHRLLKKVPEFASMESSNSRGKAVETFSNVISEIREYGQGIVVVDQIPAKMTDDVVKNTNIKIIHRTLARDDRNFVGATMNLNEDQEKELCLLEVGKAVVHREGMDKAFLVQMDLTKGVGKPVTDGEIKASMAEFHKKNEEIFFRLPGFEKMPKLPEVYAKEDFRIFHTDLYLGALGAFTLFALGEFGSVEVYKKKFSELVDRHIRTTDSLRVAAQVIRYSHLFFQKVNEAYPGCLDLCSQMNCAFVDIWFEGERDMDKAALLRSSMSSVTRNDNFLEPVLSYYTDTTSAAQRLEKEWDKSDQDSFLVLDSFLADSVKVLTGGVPVSSKGVLAMKRLLLEVVFSSSPKKTVVRKRYEAYLKQR